MDNAWLKMMFKMSTASLHTSWQTTPPLTNRCCDVTMMSSLNTALRSKQEKCLPTHLQCMLGPLRWSMPKSMKSDAKLSEIYEQNEWHLFSGQCNLRFLSTKVLQGSVGTCVNYGRIFIDYFTANLLQSVVVKEFWKSVRISRSYRQKYSGTFFSGHGVYRRPSVLLLSFYRTSNLTDRAETPIKCIPGVGS